MEFRVVSGQAGASLRKLRDASANLLRQVELRTEALRRSGVDESSELFNELSAVIDEIQAVVDILEQREARRG